jgi:hypothetical protein
MNPLRELVEHLADNVHATADAVAHAADLDVKRLPWGNRSYRDPRLASLAEARRRRLIRNGLDDLDQALMDPDTRTALAHTAAALDHQPPASALAR